MDAPLRASRLTRSQPRRSFPAPMAVQPTMREIAAEAGVSLTTVSLALRRHPRIPPETREKILRIAETHGYTRDPVVSTLMNQLRTARQHRGVEKIAVLSWWDRPGAQNARGVQLYEGMRERAKRLGYEIEEFWAREPRMTGTRLSQILHTRAIRGIVLSSMLHSRGRASLKWEHFAAATMSHTILQPRLHRVAPTHYENMILALRSLKRLGYTRVGYVNLVESEDMNNDTWLAAYLAYQFRLHGSITIPPLLTPRWDKTALKTWLARHEPQAVVSNWPELLTLLRELKLQVPADLGFACLDTLPGVEPWAGIDVRRNEVGARTIDLVVEQLQNNEYGLPAAPKTVTVEGAWHDGPTLKLPSRAAVSAGAGER
jgi:LacI family transcriptional regulator